MTFLHIAFLGGIAAVAVPIVLHLIMRQQPKHLEFPALRFIHQRKDANRRRMKFRQLLLLLLRCAAIFLLAMALARPSMQAAGMLGDQEAPVAAAFVFDTSPRMEYRLNNKTRLEEARETGTWLLTQLPPESEAAVLDSRSTGAVFAAEIAAARQRIDRLTPTPVGSPLVTVIEDAIRLVSESEKQRKEVYIFTDLSHGALPDTPPAAWQKKMQTLANVGLYIIDVGALQPRNFALGESRMPSQVLAKNSPLRLQVDVDRNDFGTDGSNEERTVELYLADKDGKQTKRSQQVTQFGESSTEMLDFRVAGLEPGVHQGYVKIAGEDNLPCDDIRYFTVLVRSPWKVLIAAPQDPNDYAFHLHEALAPSLLRLKGEVAFEIDVVPLDKLAAQKLDDFAAVCLLDPTPLSDGTWQKLAGYASAGGGVAIFLGKNARPIEEFNTAAAQDVLPGKLVRQWRNEEGFALAPDNLQHPVLSGFRSAESSIPWSAFPVFRHWEMGSLVDGAGIVIPYSNGLPALIDRPLGNGRVLTMTTPISETSETSLADSWNLLTRADDRWPFFVLSKEMFRYLVGSADVRLNYLAGETAVIPLGRQSVPIVSLFTPQGDTFRQSIDEHQNALVVASTDTVGNYRATAGSEDQRVELGFSVNLPMEVSELDRLSPDEVKALFAPVPYRLARSREEIDRSVSVGRVGVELYPYLMFLLAIVLAAEQVLGNRYYRDDKSRAADAKTIAKSMVASLQSRVASRGRESESRQTESVLP
jgi:hypothetical protein